MCYLIWNFRQVLISLSLRSVDQLHFCHACLNLWMDELAVAQCSSFVKHHEWIPAMYFVAMLECSSLLFLMHLDGLVLLIVDQCHICFACHLQTVHPFPVIFISISNEIISSFQWHAWFAKLLPCSSFSFRSTHMHRISRLAYHTCFASCYLCIPRDLLWLLCLCSCLG